MNFTLDTLQETWDLVIIGGGVTGAGILREAARSGLRVLLVEQDDFAWGTSSRSSKMVHGGLRYLADGRPMLTWESVKERQRMLREAPGLVEPLEFLTPIYKGQSPGRWMMEIGLTLYGLMALSRPHRYHDRRQFASLTPHLKSDGLKGGFQFLDAQVDDARLVLRIIHEALDASPGAAALNYTRATHIRRDSQGCVVGITVEDSETGQSRTLSTRAVINATGAWAEKLHTSPKPGLHIRPLRGSHLIFPLEKLPVTRAVSFFHPTDGRPVFATPWEGAVLVGTTDEDHDADMFAEPAVTPKEAAYLLEAAQAMFPELNLGITDCIGSLAGVRPVLSEGKLAPSKESREHVVWVEKGLVTITGGKLTTFRSLAWDALKAVRPFLSVPRLRGEGEPVFTPNPQPLPPDLGLSSDTRRRIEGRFGRQTGLLLAEIAPEDLRTIPGTHTLWAELAFAARHEQIRHLSDLLLRRVRIGLLLPEGAMAHMERIRGLCAPFLDWDDERWANEIDTYCELWQKAYQPPALDA